MNKESKKINIKKLIILTAILPVIVIAICSIVIYFTAVSAVPENALPEKEEKDIISVPGNMKEAEKTVNQLLNKAASSGILSIHSDVNVEINNITGKNKSLVKILNFVKNSYKERMGKAYKEIDVNYGGDTLFIKEIFPDVFPDGYEVSTDGHYMKISFTYPSLDGTDFEGADKRMAIKALNENKEVINVSDMNALRTKAVYIAEIDRQKGKLTNISVIRDYIVSMTFTFEDELSSLGQNDIEFESSISSSFNFSEAGIDIIQDKITLGKHGYETLNIEANIDDQAEENEYYIKFTSSDPTVATINENGVIEAHSESSSPVTITAELNYIGKTFSDTVEVWIVKEIKQIKLNKKTLKMEKGDEYQLNASIKPADATIKNITWISESPKTVYVDSTGKITAINTGKTKIYAISDDGEHGIACTVTVQ